MDRLYVHMYVSLFIFCHTACVSSFVPSTDHVHVIKELQGNGLQSSNEDGIFVTKTHDNKCLMYSLPVHLVTSS